MRRRIMLSETDHLAFEHDSVETGMHADNRRSVASGQIAGAVLGD